MYWVVRGLCRGRAVILRSLKKKPLKTVDINCFQSFYISTNIMPKRKAAPAKTETVDDIAAGGDQPDALASRARRGKAKKEPETENVVGEEKEKKGRTKKIQKEEKTKNNEEDKPKRGTKKPVPAKDSTKDKEKIIEKKKPTRGKKVTEVAEEISDSDEHESKITKRKGKKDEETNGVAKEKTTRKKKADVSPEEPKAKGRKKVDKEEKDDKPGPSNSTITKWDKINFTCTKKNGEGQKANLKISCWNIGGLKSWIKKDCLQFLKYEDPDIFCVQETKCSEDKLPEEIKELQGYKQYWCASEKEGYAGVGLLTKEEPLNVTYGINNSELDEDGRCITAEFENYYVVCVYVPNAGRKLVTLPKRLKWNEVFKDYIQSLDSEKPVIIAGDMNVAHNEIDLARPANNTKNAGFTQEERDGMTDFLEDGYLDTFRKLYPDKTDVYTFWTYMANARSKNIGWRLDYIIVSERIMDKVCDNVIRSEILGSDHCPFTLFINI